MNQLAPPSHIHAGTNPFDPSATARLRRANLIDENSEANVKAISTLASSFAAFLYDDICDSCDSCDCITAIKETLLNAQASGLPKRKLFLHICLQYDTLHKPLPDVMWWMAGNDGVVAAFVDAYIAKFIICCADMEQEVSNDES
ncbi:hypothetical protein RFF05_08520 [Bengtsoniella intestinalis]|uniref:hypothetical protein n=1 Tax=Bengtsoniella intestinalis TaxID=3073143 RepID=UPI00391F1427